MAGQPPQWPPRPLPVLRSVGLYRNDDHLLNPFESNVVEALQLLKVGSRALDRDAERQPDKIVGEDMIVAGIAW